MAWCRSGDKPLSEPMMAKFNDAYTRHLASMSLIKLKTKSISTKNIDYISFKHIFWLVNFLFFQDAIPLSTVSCWTWPKNFLLDKGHVKWMIWHIQFRQKFQNGEKQSVQYQCSKLRPVPWSKADKFSGGLATSGEFPYHFRIKPVLTPVTFWSSSDLTHCGLVTPYGDRDLGQHWLR